jgi:hypothetical protein
MRTTNRTAVAIFTLVLAAGAGTACGAQDRGLDDRELGAMIDSLLPPIAEASGLEVRRSVRFSMQSREDARRFIQDQLDRELGPEELAGMERAYKALGLLPETLDLRGLLLELYTEQVVGYYDPATDRLYVVEGVTRGTAGPVVAHELVHALQDQLTDLDSLVARDRGNDRQMAAQAAAEGQATLVMIALQAAESSGDAIDPGRLPDLGEMMRPALEAENEQFPIFQNAPRLIRETLLFPYLGGASYVQALFRNRAGAGVPVPFGEDLPQSTEQVLDPAGRFVDGPDVPTELELGAPGSGWRVVYQNTLGQLETRILLTEHAGPGAAVAAGGWDGDRYALLEGPDGGEAVVWYSVWDDAESADRFAARLAGAGDRWRVERIDADGRPGVRAVIAEGPVPPVPALVSAREVPTR